MTFTNTTPTAIKETGKTSLPLRPPYMTDDEYVERHREKIELVARSPLNSSQSALLDYFYANLLLKVVDE